MTFSWSVLTVWNVSGSSPLADDIQEEAKQKLSNEGHRDSVDTSSL
jgi:hypothetical protein